MDGTADGTRYRRQQQRRRRSERQRADADEPAGGRVRRPAHRPVFGRHQIVQAARGPARQVRGTGRSDIPAAVPGGRDRRRRAR